MDMSVYKQAQLAYKKSNDQLLDLLETLQQMAWVAIPNGKVVYFNRQWHNYTGMKPGQTEGWVKFIHPEDSPLAIAAWNQALTSGHYQAEYRIRNQEDGSYKWFLEQGEPITDESGKILLWIGTYTDIDDQKQGIEP